MHVFQRPVVRIGALLLAVLYVVFEVVRARGGVVASSLLLFVYLTVGVASVWWWLFSFAARVRRGWPALSKAIGVWQQEPVSRIDETFEYRYPRILRIRRHELGFDVTVSLLPGQTPKNLGDHVEGIAHTWGVFRVEASSPGRGVVVLRAWFADPLAESFEAPPMPGLGDVVKRAAGLASIRYGKVAAEREDPWRPEFASAEIGRCDDGRPWRLRLHGTHVLVAGVTGAGKGSVLWGVVRALLPAARVGIVQLWACDPKRMELSYGRSLFQRYACEPAAMVELLEAAAAEMNTRAQTFAGKVRKHEPSASCPFVVVIVDELAFLTAYQPDRDLRKRADAAIATLTSQGRSVGFCVIGALQDPRKEVMNIRNLFPDRIALRLDEPNQVDMVLGNGARERGAAADLISPDPEVGAGVGYVKRETQPEPVRVRAAFVSDDAIDAMVRDYGRSSGGFGSAA
ncbi:FtsK/SpoIIIE domain-containing protein [Embleya sp. NBC_00896]|uniref:FtsK/SpoIIIE domain-containing protein n=1 Tax=Embleya sp. NBC_00896 TaxID=2975961 RepID=UPI003865319B|nr:FtsK/SpoIIIE domain-containing protein [Embleya sp. NBC_00896]